MELLNAAGLTKRITDVSEPVLTWFTLNGEERIELSGPVARRWIAKTDNFMASEFPYGGERFCIVLPPHWRTPFWLLIPWMRGMRLETPHIAADVDLVVSADSGFLQAVADEGGPDALLAQNLDSLALSWPGELPGTLLDGIADVMTYGDWVEDPVTAKPGTHLVSESIDWVPPNLWTKPKEQTLPIETLGSLDYVGSLFAVGDGKGRLHPGASSGQESPAQTGLPLSASSVDLEGARVLVHTLDPVLFTAQLAGLWMAGARVIWAPGDGIPQEILDQERPDYLLPSGTASGSTQD
ncbi:MAG: TIGR03089 family protein [Scrofimicrobium sp.]